MAGCSLLPGDVRAPVALSVRAEAATPEAARVAAEAARILSDIRTTVYSHTTRVDETAGTYEMDCSGLVRHVLDRTSPGHLAAIVAETGQTPRVIEFYTVFKARQDSGSPRGGWAAVPRLLDARPGDLLAWRRLIALPGDTGHIMIVMSAPAAQPDGTVSVQVIDSTTTPHDVDTRTPGVTGVGCGTMGFRVDVAGAPVAFRRNSRLPFQELPMAIGRLAALPEE
jgi:hypothetical protein